MLHITIAAFIVASATSYASASHVQVMPMASSFDPFHREMHASPDRSNRRYRGQFGAMLTFGNNDAQMSVSAPTQFSSSSSSSSSVPLQVVSQHARRSSTPTAKLSVQPRKHTTKPRPARMQQIPEVLLPVTTPSVASGGSGGMPPHQPSSSSSHAVHTAPSPPKPHVTEEASHGPLPGDNPLIRFGVSRASIDGFVSHFNIMSMLAMPFSYREADLYRKQYVPCVEEMADGLFTVRCRVAENVRQQFLRDIMSLSEPRRNFDESFQKVIAARMASKDTALDPFWHDQITILYGTNTGIRLTDKVTCGWGKTGTIQLIMRGATKQVIVEAVC